LKIGKKLGAICAFCHYTKSIFFDILLLEIKSRARPWEWSLTMKVYATYNRTLGTWKVTQNRQTLASGLGLDSFISILNKYPRAVSRWVD
jgi:hypothetical protein